MNEIAEADQLGEHVCVVRGRGREEKKQERGITCYDPAFPSELGFRCAGLWVVFSPLI